MVSGEFGGITQHIGAYQVHVDDRVVTFLDTPGRGVHRHAQARGAGDRWTRSSSWRPTTA